MKAKHLRSRIARIEALAHDSSPQSSSRTELCHLFQELIVRVEEERDARRELINVESAVHRGLYISDCVRQSERHFLRGSRTCFPNVIARDRDRVPSWNFTGAVTENVGYDPQTRARRVNISPANDVLLQNVVLNGA